MNTITIERHSVTPSKIVCVGRNYVDHIAELGNEIPEGMVVFFKPNSAISTTLHAFHHGEQVHYEAEICFVVRDGVFAAVGVGLDLTKRGLQERLRTRGLPWERAKAFDGSALFGPFANYRDEGRDLVVELHINGDCRQQGSTAQMTYRPADILQEIKTFTTLADGDIVMTGTPAGVGAIVPGDTYRGAIICDGRTLASCSWQAVA